MFYNTDKYNSMLQSGIHTVKEFFISSEYSDMLASDIILTFSDCRVKESITIEPDNQSYLYCKKMTVMISSQQDSQISIQREILTQKQSFTYNFSLNNIEELFQIIDSYLHVPFGQLHIQMSHKDLYIRSQGKYNSISSPSLFYKYTAPSKKNWVNKSFNDLEKDMLVNPYNAEILLKALGICDQKGIIIPSMRDKYKQINHFINLYKQQSSHIDTKKIRIIDSGCGKAYISFSLLWWMINSCNLEVELYGLEYNPVLVDFCNTTSKNLGLEHRAHFECISIGDWNGPKIDEFAEVHIALHACDTATDDALLLALDRKAAIILAAPCCHHYVQQQMNIKNMPENLSLLLKDGIAKERLGDLITDSMRKDILCSQSYSADLIEFTPLEHTAKNIMIRAVYIHNMPHKHKQEAMERWQNASKEFNVKPKLAEYILNQN